MTRMIRVMVVIALLVWALPGAAFAQDGDPVERDPVHVAQTLLDNLLLGDFEAATADFDAKMQELLTPDALAQTWASILGQVGAFQQQVAVDSASNGTLTLVTIIVQFDLIALDFQITVNTDGQVSGFYIQPHEEPITDEHPVPAYADPAMFTERDIVLNAGTEWELPGTLTIPVGAGPFPAVVLVHGSGPQDRDESYASQKPFKDIAWGLASQGITVLRYDKRTYVYGEEMVAAGEVTVKAEAIDDALAAVALLQTVEEVDPARVVVLGHSLGGYLAPGIAAQNDAVAGVVIMAGNSRPLEDLLVDQIVYIVSLDGDVSPDEQATIDKTQAQVDRVKSLTSAEDVSADDELLGTSAAYWIDLRAYDPLPIVSTLAVPVLVLQGERDYQVTMVDFQGWQGALVEHDNATLITYPALDHLFVAGEGPSTPDDYLEPGNVDEAVIIDIAHWVLALD